MTDAEFEQLIGPYLAGELDGETVARVRAYLEETPGRQGFVAGIRGAVRSEDVGVAPEAAASRRRLVEKLGDVERMFEGRLSGARVGVTGDGVSGGVYNRFGFRGQTLRGGMAVLGSRTLPRVAWIGAMTAFVVGVVFLTRRVPETHSEITRMYATTAQQQAVVNLDDGTRVTLAPRTKLRLAHFGAQSRTVFLESGEAYFEVAHTAGAPFVVRSGTATAQVLGTAFLIRHDAGDSHVRVAVTDGKVRVTTPTRAGTGITLTTGQAGDVTDSTAQVSTTDDLAPGTEWLPGRVVFHHTSLAAVLQTVSQWYGYHFRYADSTLSARSVTMMVSMRSSAEALATIERVLAVNLTVVGDTVTLVPQSPQSGHGTPRIRTYDVWTPTREVGR